MESLKYEVSKELTENILPFWMIRMADSRNGFPGRIDGMGKACHDAEKGAVLNARILWTFSSAGIVFDDRRYLDIADRTYEYFARHFIDKDFGGVFWSLDCDGAPSDTKKQIYALAFAIYAFSEYYRASGNREALSLAVSLFDCIEGHSFDKEFGGYLEACARDWGTIADMRLSEKDQNDAKTMNTHLHILEAYTALYRSWPDARLATALRNTIVIFLEKIVGKDGHLGLFFDEEWRPNSTLVSYGHDIEASWLLCEAASVLGDGPLVHRVREVSGLIASASMEGFSMKSGMEYEFDPATAYRNASRDWWVQAETVVGCINQFQLSGDEVWKERALSEWNFIKKYIICPDGEWYWAAIPQGDGFVPDTVNDRAGFWKCPYHNARMCLELIQRLSER